MYLVAVAGLGAKGSGALLSCLPRLNTGGNLPMENCSTRSSKGHPGGPMSWGEALLWGTVVVALLLGVLGAAYFLLEQFMFG
jgi:hypothetical protein